MARADYLELDFGQSRWMKRAITVLLLLCILALLISPAPWVWKISACFLLAMAHLLAQRLTASPLNNGVVRIFQDNTAMLSTASERRLFATLAARHWVSPWFCSIAVHLARGGRKRFLIVCATENDADEYRRLLKYLRMRPPASDQERMIW
jgi:hypothetical protein